MDQHDIRDGVQRDRSAGGCVETAGMAVGVGHGVRTADSRETATAVCGGCVESSASRRGDEHDASEDGTGRGVPIVMQQHGSDVGRMGALRSGRGDIQSGVPFVFEARVARNGRGQPDSICPSLKAESGKGDSAPCVVIRTANTSANGHGIAHDVAHALDSANGQCIAFDCRAGGKTGNAVGTVAHTLHNQEHGARASICIGTTVRKLTPLECERLQGFPDYYTQIVWGLKAVAFDDPTLCPNAPRYRAIGNSMAVPVIEWIGRRIEMVDGMNEVERGQD